MFLFSEKEKIFQQEVSIYFLQKIVHRELTKKTLRR